MILKAQELYFDISTSIVHKYEDGMTNIGKQYGTHKAGCPRHQCHPCWPLFVTPPSYLWMVEVWSTK